MDNGHLQFRKSNPVLIQEFRENVVDFVHGPTAVARQRAVGGRRDDRRPSQPGRETCMILLHALAQYCFIVHVSIRASSMEGSLCVSLLPSRNSKKETERRKSPYRVAPVTATFGEVARYSSVERAT